MELEKLSDEELDDLYTSVLIEKMTREGMRRLTVSDLYKAKEALDRVPTIIGDISYDFVPMPVMPIINIRELVDVGCIAPFGDKVYGVKTGFNPFPMHGVNPNDVFNKKRKKKKRIV